MNKGLSIAGLLFLIAGGLVYWRVGYEPKTFIPNRVANDYSSEWQVQRQIQPGWVLLAVARRVDRPTRMVHRVKVVPELAGKLLTMHRSERVAEIGRIACPQADHDIWQKLSSRQDIEVEVEAEKGPFAVISCRQAVL